MLGITTMALVVFSNQISKAYPMFAPMLRPFTGIAWPWYVLIGTTITMSVGIVSSYTHSSSGEAEEARE